MISLNGVQETLLIPLAIKASETKRSNARIHDLKAVEIIEKLNLDTSKYDKFMSHEGVVARTILLMMPLSTIWKNTLNPFAFLLDVVLIQDSQESIMEY